ncbi:MAG: response regulator [Thermodesulfobacteriota bacterium]
MTKLLLIDDEEPIRKVLGLYLRSREYEVFTAADGNEGIEVFQRERPAIVLTDIKMPGMDGIEVLQRIKKLAPETQVIVITGHGDMALAIQALQLEASDFITKPVDNKALLVSLRRAEERLETQEVLKATHEYMKRAEKLIAISDISAKIAHEIRTPLTLIGGFADRLRKKASLRAPEEKYAGVIVDEVARLENFINDILLFTGEIVLDKKELHVNKLIADVVLLFEKEMEEQGITVHTLFDERVPVIMQDKKSLEEVFINLIVNACHAMKGGGELTLRTEHLPAETGGVIRITVTDTGEGIPETIINKVFDPFFTTKTVGSGLGLTVVKEILRRHNGTIHIESAVKKGTIVTIEIGV